MAGFFECLGRTPFGSLLAFMLVVVGAAVFCGTLYRALTLVIEGILVQLFGFTLQWLEVVQIMFVVIGVVMGVVSILLLIFAFLATGATRQNVYSGAKCIMGGRISAGFFILISFILCLAWVAITCVAMVPVLLYVSIDTICDREIYSHTAQELDDMKYCFQLSRFGFYRSAEGQMADGSDQLCEHTELRTMCNRVLEAGPLFCVAFACSIVILLGMIIYLICLAANYTRIKISKELTQYRDAVEMEELDVNNTNFDPQKGPPPYLIDTRSSVS